MISPRNRDTAPDRPQEAAHSDSLLARYRAILETAVDAIVTIDESGQIHSINSSTERMFQFPPDELVGRNIATLMPEPYRSEHDQYLARYLAGGPQRVIGIGREATGRRKDGTVFPVHLAVSEFVIDGRRFFTGIIRDISTLQQVQQKLLQSERLAAIGETVTGLAHESRNALQRAQACLDMLSLDLEGRPEQLDLTTRARTAIEDLHRLYEEVRNYAAPIHLEYCECELAPIWQQAWADLDLVREGRTIVLVTEPGSTSVHCRLDRRRITQVFRNVFENAITACPDPGRVTVSAAHTDNGVRICIGDNGGGVAPDAHQQVFQPFFTTRQKGTGLGLAIVKRIVETHDGRIEIGKSATGGAEVLITLPRTPL